MSRTVTGTLLLPNGQPMANARIFFTAKRTEAISIVEGVNAFFDTNGSGVYNQVIVDGWYSVSIEWQADAAGATVRRWQLGNAVVEAGASTTLEALIIASNPAASVETTLLYEVLEQAQQARDEAEAAAVAAAASAATISPAKQAQWDQAFTERNRWDGGSAGLVAATGRASLNLGTAATTNVTTSTTDDAVGSAVLTNYRGLGNTGIAWNLLSGNYFAAGNNFDSASAATVYFGIGAFNTGQTGIQIGARNGNVIVRSYTSGVIGSEHKMWSTFNTSADVQTLLNAANKSSIGNAVAEEGSFTPIASGQTSSGAGTYTVQIGRYRKIGSRVEVQIHIGWSAHTGTGRIFIGNFPFTSNSQTNRWASFSLYFSGLSFTAGRQVFVSMGANSNSASLTETSDTGVRSDINMQNVVTGIVICGSYEV